MKKFLLVVLTLMFLSTLALSAKVESPATPRTHSNSREPGDTCEEALSYGNINDQAVTGSTTVALESDWYEFVLDDAYGAIEVSLAGSTFDTKLEVWGECDDATYLAYNDDFYGAQSAVFFDVLPAGTYYARVYGYSSAFGDYVLTITGGDPPTMGFIDGVVTDFGTALPIEGAMVSAGGLNATTDVSGYYNLNVQSGIYNVVATAYGYISNTVTGVEVLANETTTVDFGMEVFETAGTSCADPYFIDALPFVETGMTTEGFGDDYDNTMACANYYMGGDDFVFSYTPTENMSVDITLTNTLTYTGVFVIQGFVDDPAAVCVAMSTVYGGNPFLEDVVLPMGETYYIVVSTWPAPQFTPFDIAITANEPPTFGSLDGTVTNVNEAAIEGAVVSAGGFSEITDINGYYMFAGLETGIYTVSVMADGYYGASETDVEILEGQTTTVDFVLDVFSDIGDTIEDPIVIDAFPYFMSGDISLYTDYSTGAGLVGSRSGQDIYYEFTVTEPSVMDLNACGSDFDTYMNLYDSAYTQIAYDDDGCPGTAGNSMAAWIAVGNGFLVQPGTYYICHDAYSFNAGYRYFEVHFDILPPPAFGSIDGTVTDFVTGEPIVGANVTTAGTTLMTDDMGYYLFGGLELGLYDIAVALTGYNPGAATGVEVLEDVTTTVDFALDPIVGVVFEVTSDSWGYEISWNVWDVTNGIFIWDVDQTFAGNNVTEIYSEDLADGDYVVYVYDAYGDGGMSGIVSKEGILLVQWASSDYTTQGEFPFTVSPILWGGLEGFVTDNYTGDPIAGATIACGNYQGMSDDMGYYNIPEVLVGDYDATCDAGGYTGSVAPVTILEDVVATQDFALDINMTGPTNLVATAVGYDVGLAWEEPYNPPTDMLHWDDMENFDAIGMTGGGIFSVAARFTPTELAPFDGLVMDNVTVYINDLPTDMTLYVWTGANAANVLVQQTVTPVGIDWNNFVLNTPVLIDASDELWIGYEVTHADLMFPAGCDAGPAVAGYGDMITMDGGVTWDPLSGFGLDYNWNIWGGIAGEAGRNQVLARPQTWHPEAIQVDSRVKFAAAGIGETVRDFTGEYNVYRDDVVIATVAETTYDDMGLAAGMYEYYVTAVYDEGESPETNHEVVELGMAIVSVNPTVLSETLDYGLTSDYNIELSNSGDGNFYWNGSIAQQARLDVGETKPRTANSVGEDAELAPNAEMFDVPETRDMWDMLYTGVIGADIVSQAAVEFDGTYIYTAVWNAATINKYDIDGNFIESFSIPGVLGLRDLAYDGQYFYGGAGGTALWEMDFENQTLVSTITSAVAVRAIAYDDDLDGFWVNNWDTAITLVGRDGSVMDSFPCSITYGSWYGMAYDNITDGGPYIYGFSQAGSGCVINQMNIETGADTGVFHDVLEDTGVVGDIAGGLFTSIDYESGTLVIGALNQGSYTLTVYELSPASAWLAIEPNSGTLAPGESVNITATFNAIELPGLTYYADIVFSDGLASAAVAADLTITGSIPTAEITVDPVEFDVTVPVDGMADYMLNIGNLGDLDLEYDAEIMYYEGRAVAEAYPQSADYWTGSTDGTSFTSTSMINGIDLEDGWAMFDVSGIPDGAVINSVDCSVYVNSANYCYWSITPCTLDPLTTDAATLSAHLIAGELTGVAYSYNNESSTFPVGWHTYPLGTTVIADLEAALGQDWFACGMTSRDNSVSYWINIDGWNEANPPYLTIDYSVPINPWVTFDGDMTTGGMVAVGAGADMIPVNFDATGLMDGDVMMGEIMITSNDLYNTEIIVPVTMTVGAAYMYGDVTGDELVDAFDAANILQFTVGMDPIGAPLPWTWELLAGDVDGNGDPEAYDAALVLQYAVGMIDEFPVETRTESPAAEVSMTVENGEFIFSTTGDLNGFSVMTETDLISFQAPVVDYLHAINGNKVALASA
ncbi:MAG: carboxypeptidase regulatory-like domain-containing protein, partial [Candidatus Stygibacter frigidus]|nr:carboxypeptidase regulatory-like domain-containing protein [Candidatus Stygibacter frigidus]